MRNLNRLAGKRAIVTGGASGIGEAIAKLFLDEGCAVVVVDRDRAGFEHRFQDYPAAGFCEADVGEPAAAARIVEEALATLQGLDILVNQAGIGTFVPLDRTSDEEWSRVMEVNVGGMFRITRAAIPHLRKSKAGRIINTGSMLSEIADSDLGVYTTSKHAVAGLTKSLAIELGPEGITANTIQPGPIMTETARTMFAERPEWHEFQIKKVPLGRMGEPIEVAYLALFLASDESSFINGAGIMIDGGATKRP